MSDLYARRRLMEYQSDCWWRLGDKRWDEVLSSADVAASAYIELSDPNVSDRFAYAETRRAFVMAASKLDVEQYGKRGERTWGALDQLLDWLRACDEPLLRSALASRLLDKVLWLGGDESVFEAADELLGVLEESEDLALKLHVARYLMRDMPWLLQLEPDDVAIINAGAAIAIRTGEVVADLEPFEISAASLDRGRRLLGLMDRLAEILRAIDASSARELLSWTLVERAGLAGWAGDSDVAQRSLDEIVGLGDDGAAGFDLMFDEDMRINGEKRPSDYLAGRILISAQVLEALGRHDEARRRFRYFIKRFKARDEPCVVAMVELASSELAALPRGDGS